MALTLTLSEVGSWIKEAFVLHQWVPRKLAPSINSMKGYALLMDHLIPPISYTMLSPQQGFKILDLFKSIDNLLWLTFVTYKWTNLEGIHDGYTSILTMRVYAVFMSVWGWSRRITLQQFKAPHTQCSGFQDVVPSLDNKWAWSNEMLTEAGDDHL